MTKYEKRQSDAQDEVIGQRTCTICRSGGHGTDDHGDLRGYPAPVVKALPAPKQIAGRLLREQEIAPIDGPAACARIGAEAAYKAVREALEAEADENDGCPHEPRCIPMHVCSVRRAKAVALRAFAARLLGGS